MSKNFKKFVLPVEGGSVVVGRIKEIMVRKPRVHYKMGVVHLFYRCRLGEAYLVCTSDLAIYI